MVENPVNEKIFKMTCPNFNLSLGQVKSKSDTLGPLLSDIKLIEHANVNIFFLQKYGVHFIRPELSEGFIVTSRGILRIHCQCSLLHIDSCCMILNIQLQPKQDDCFSSAVFTYLHLHVYVIVINGQQKNTTPIDTSIFF